MHLAAVAEGNVDPAADAFVDDRGDADSAGLGKRLQPRGHVDAVAVDVVALDDDVAEVDADAERDSRPRILRGRRIALDEKRAVDRIDDAGEFDQRAVADQFDDAAAMLGNRRVEQRLAMPLQGGERPGLVTTHQAGVADDVGRKDGGEPARGAHFRHALFLMGYPVMMPANQPYRSP